MRIAVYLIILCTLCMMFSRAFSQPMRTTKGIILYSQPSTSAPAPTYPPAKSLIEVKEKVNEGFYRVLYRDYELYLPEPSLAYCIPVDTTGPEFVESRKKVIASPNYMDVVMNWSPAKPWFTKEYGVDSLNRITPEQFRHAWSLAKFNLYTGNAVTTVGLSSLGIGLFFVGIGFVDGYWASLDSIVLGFLLSAGGILNWAIGYPFKAGGKIRMKQLEQAFPGITRGVSINPYFERHLDRYYSGLTLSFAF